MVKYSCKRCCKDFAQKSHYDKHMSRKNPCKDVRKEIEYLVEKKIDEKMGGEKIKFIDLFAGTGAFTLALEKSGKFKCVFSNDIDKNSEQIYNLNNPTHDLYLADLNTINVDEIPAHDLLCAGFPCQPFSIAGKQKGFQDERSNVFWKILEIMKKHEPKIILLENVKNLKTHDKGNTFKIITRELQKLGYKLKDKVLDTCKITEIPQHRERIYIVGFKDENMYNTFDLQFETMKNRQIIDLMEPDVDQRYYYTDRFKVYDAIESGVEKDITTGTLYQYRRYYVRENKNNCCPTLTANMGSGGHNVPLLRDSTGIRKLTPRECFNMQGFPASYKLPHLSDAALYKLAGNAVSVPVVELIVDKLCKLL